MDIRFTAVSAALGRFRRLRDFNRSSIVILGEGRVSTGFFFRGPRQTTKERGWSAFADHDGLSERALTGQQWRRPTTHVLLFLKLHRAKATIPRMVGGWVYIMTNRPDGTLYVGVTSDLARRVFEHREGLVDGFTRRYELKRLVYAERHDDIRDAIRREKTIKTWRRAWKVRLIRKDNPGWTDLYDALL